MPTLAEPVLALAESRPSASPLPAACLPPLTNSGVQPHCLPPNSPGRRWPSPPVRRSPRRPHARPASVPQRRAPCSSPHPPPRTVGRAFCGAKHARGRVKGRGKGRCEGRCEARCEGRCETAAGPGRSRVGLVAQGGVGARALRRLFARFRPEGALGLQARARRDAGWQGCGSPREAAETL